MSFRSWHRICALALLFTIGVPLRLVPTLNGGESASHHQHTRAFVPFDDKGVPGDAMDGSSDESRAVVGGVTSFSWNSPSKHYPHLQLLLSGQAPLLLLMRLVRTSYVSSAI